MSKRSMWVAVCLAGVLALSAAAQTAPPAAKPTVGHYYWQTPKAGMQTQFEAGRKKHMAFHKTAGDKFGWTTWEVVVGEEAGAFLVGTYGHQWSDFDGRDDFDKQDTADVAKNVAAFTESSTNSFWYYEPGMSLSPEGEPPSKYMQVTSFTVKPESVRRFRALAMEIKAVLKKANVPWKSRWYSLSTGGVGPAFVLVSDRKSWAEFAPQEKGAWDYMTEAHGAEKADQMRQEFTSTYTRVSSYVAAYRADLSYNVEAQGKAK